MTLIMFVFPTIVVIIGALVAHSVTRRFWRACTGITLFTAGTYLVYLVILGGFRLHILGVSAVASMIAFLIAVIVGIPFVLDRRIQERDSIQRKWE